MPGFRLAGLQQRAVVCNNFRVHQYLISRPPGRHCSSLEGEARRHSGKVMSPRLGA
jgi:hypothetical protein